MPTVSFSWLITASFYDIIDSFWCFGALFGGVSGQKKAQWNQESRRETERKMEKDSDKKLKVWNVAYRYWQNNEGCLLNQVVHAEHIDKTLQSQRKNLY